MNSKLSKFFRFFMVSLIVLSNIPFHIFINVHAQNITNEDVLQLNSKRSGWQLVLNASNFDSPQDQWVDFIIDGTTKKVNSLSLITSNNQEFPINITTDKEQFQKNINNYQNYQQDIQAYEQAIENYSARIEEYQESKKANEQEWLAYQEAWDNYNEEIENYEINYQAYVDQYNQYIDNNQEVPADLVEPQLPTEPNLEEPKAFIREEPVEPIDPTNEQAEKLWQLALKSDSTKEAYQLWIPKKYFNSTIEVDSKSTEEITKDYKVEAFSTFSGSRYKASEVVSKSLPKEEASISDKKTTTSEEAQKTRINPSDNESEAVKPVIKESVLVGLNSNLSFEDVIENYGDFPKDTSFEWLEKINTSKVGTFENKLKITQQDGEISEWPTTYEVIKPDFRMMARAAVEPPKAEVGKFTIFAVDDFDKTYKPVEGVTVKLHHYKYIPGSFPIGYDINPVTDKKSGNIELISDASGYTSYYGIERNGQYPLYYVEVVGTPDGFAAPNKTILEAPNGGLSGFPNPKIGEFYGAYDLSARGLITPNNSKILQPIADNGNTVASNAAVVRVRRLVTDVEFKKIDKDTGAPLANAVFELKKQGDNDFSQIINSDEKGIATFKDLGIGTYELKESSPPDGYIRSENTYTFEINQDTNKTKAYSNNFRVISKGSTKSLGDITPIIENKVNKLLIHKVDESGKPLKGSTFTLKDIENKTIEPDSDQSNPIFEYSKLKPGTYTLIEDTAPQGYYLTQNNKWTFIVGNDGKIELNGNKENIKEEFDSEGDQIFKITNNQHFIDFSFTNRGQNWDALTGGKFKLTNIDTKEVYNSNLIDQSGQVRFDHLKVGTYELIETENPPGYIKQNLKTTFDIELLNDNSGLVINNIKTFDLDKSETEGIDPVLTFSERTNQYNYFNVRESYFFIKVDEEGQGLADAQFKVVNDANPKDVLIKTSDSQGRVTLNRTAAKPNSTFTIQEIRAPLGYQVSDTVWKIETNKYGEVTMKYPDDANEFDGSSVVDGQADQIKMKNYPLEYTIEFTKIGLNSIPLSGAEFTLTSVELKEGKYIDKGESQSIESDASGKVIFKGLSEGFYRLQETKTPIGYLEQENAYDIIEIKLDKTNNKLMADLISGYNDLLFGDDNQGYYVSNVVDDGLKITKYGYSENGTTTSQTDDSELPFGRKVIPLQGVKFELKGNLESGEEYYQTVVSNANGLAVFPEVGIGSYELRELKAPNTHLKSNAVYNIDVTSGSDGIETKISRKSGSEGDDFLWKDDKGKYDLNYAINKENPTNIKFIKIANDTQNTPLAGAQFEIYEYDPDNEKRIGESLATSISEEDGIIEFKQLPVGRTYEVVEVKSPTNYETVAGGKVSALVKVSEQGEVTWLSESDEFWIIDKSNKEFPRVINKFNPIEIDFNVRDDINNANGLYGNSLDNAEFKLTRINGIPNPNNNQLVTSESWTATSNENGYVDFSPQLTNYRPQRAEDGYVYFYLEQTTVPDGYQSNVLPVIIRVDDNNDVSVNPDDLIKNEGSVLLDANLGYIVFNEKIITDLSFDKIDGENSLKKLSGTKFRLISDELDQNDSPIIDQTVTQDRFNSLIFRNLPIGTYQLIEIKAPAGYNLLGQPLSITIEEAKDSNGKRTGNAVFILDEKQKDFIEKIDSNQDGTANKIVVKNYESRNLIRTGGMGVLIYLLSGTILILLSGYYFLKTRKTYKRR
ncbi:SpaA isopeptide-forming pilin-related protein [Facklamia sp. 7083-14-GEN3]|uniref:SpaA isopeptide-forming pilin-related protein n=1 Tax=Facklamia sp. 7083-14-GEN3 TaxID=2973478 RepID=UPI00215C2A77|nr:SpaA isopeptide-forming pilin-related protein [Facklamia sp. 7083-14-GEN3]MCR8968883.1 SpaA isopeptide-forming pilin-related protein [Facklamia sp. 7083-14-GEN3]